MPAHSFNAAMHEPKYGGGKPQWPVGKGFLGIIVGSSIEPTKDGSGGKLVFEIEMKEGPAVGMVGDDQLNVFNKNSVAVEIANKQLSAYCHAVGVFQFDQTEQLHNRAFRFDTGYQKGQEPSADKPNGGFTEIKNVYAAGGASAAPAPIPPAAAPAPAPAPVAAPAAAPAPGWNAAPPAQAAPAPAAPAAGWVQPAAAPAPAAPAGPGGWTPGGGAAAPTAWAKT